MTGTTMLLGVDLGGTKIEAVALAEAGDGGGPPPGAELVRRRVPTPSGDYRAILAAVASLVRDVEAAAGGRAARVGVGLPGALSPATGRLRNSNTTVLNGQPIDRDLAAVLGREVRIANDANCFALSEATDGAGVGAHVVFGVILGTGVGGGVVVGGRVLGGPHGIAGEWGHNPLPWPEDDERPGPPCYCGKSGCIETFLSGPGLERSYAALARAKLSGIEVAAAATHDAAAEAVLRRYEDRLARALATVINLLDPEVVVLGGGVSNLARLYESVPRLWPKYVFSDVVRTKLVPARFGDSSGVRGAAWL